MRQGHTLQNSKGCSMEQVQLTSASLFSNLVEMRPISLHCQASLGGMHMNVLVRICVWSHIICLLIDV